MRLLDLLSPLLLVLALPGCSAERAPQAAPEPERAAAAPAPATDKAAPKQASATAVKALDKKQFGAPITESRTTALPEILKDPGKYGGQTVRTEGIVSSVCQSRGCWMEIADESGAAHIKMAGHSFFVPREASGHRAVIQGKMATSADEGASCGAKDGCRDQAEKETGRVAKVEIEATGIEFLD